jgi:hypothetical protein
MSDAASRIGRRSGDVVAEIKAAVDPRYYDFGKAEGRSDFDDALRAELVKIEDSTLRFHAAEMIKEWRWTFMPRPIRHLSQVHQELELPEQDL